MTRMEVSMVIDLVHEGMNANDRHDRRTRAYRTRLLRGKSAALHKMARAVVLWNAERAHLVIRITWPTHIKRDAHNLMPTFKALIDGAVDAGVLPDDSDEYLTGPDLRVEHALSGIYGAARITFEWEAHDAD